MTTPANPLAAALHDAAAAVAAKLDAMDRKLDVLLAQSAAAADADRAWPAPPKPRPNGHAKGNGQ
ncbi:hypothetical protein [Acidiphilium acidophilum]|uniref:Uncharacterized protein n=1 Tax=Acidiphilium acidophilum TaxID=76588 RepID=A0AAW9DNC8_ACIAO|nr:hypothetical protein [Acidiphilium acidophilum]MDX5930505.1 hypothetical protein [Acidiphilium acidophilum]GBR73357.1 hypothetical protein AA700_0059 [Acidiphilium acidophilum DSM 700]